MASTPVESQPDGKGSSCEAAGNWISEKGQGIGRCEATFNTDVV